MSWGRKESLGFYAGSTGFGFLSGAGRRTVWPPCAGYLLASLVSHSPMSPERPRWPHVERRNVRFLESCCFVIESSAKIFNTKSVFVKFPICGVLASLYLEIRNSLFLIKEKAILMPSEILTKKPSNGGIQKQRQGMRDWERHEVSETHGNVLFGDVDGLSASNIGQWV